MSEEQRRKLTDQDVDVLVEELRPFIRKEIGKEVSTRMAAFGYKPYRCMTIRPTIGLFSWARSIEREYGNNPRLDASGNLMI